MCLDNELEISLLVPNMEATIGTTRVANTIFIKNSGIHLGLLELGSKGTILEQFLTAVSWVPELERSGSHSHEFQIVGFSRPLDVVDGVGTSRNVHQLFVSLNVEDVHDVVVALVNGCDVPLARTDGEGSHTLSFRSKRKVGDRCHRVGVPNMNRGDLAALT